MRVVLQAGRDVSEPRVRTEVGFVRVWFPDMVGWTNIDLEGDGGAVRFVRVRPGIEDTGVVILRIGDHRRVPESAVRVTREGVRVMIAIARVELPPARVAAPVAPPEAAPVTVAVPEPAAPTVPVTPAAEASTLSPVDDRGRSAAEALTAPLSPSTSEVVAPVPLGVPASEGRSSLLVLLLITALLGGALAGIRYWQSRRATAGLAPSIRIVAATRLSPKQQLLVVRALGQDHLIAIEPGRTERLLSIQSPEPRAEEIVPELRLSREPGAASHAPTLLGPQPASPSAAPPHFGSAFGRELLRLVEAKPDLPIASSIAPMQNAPNESVAGLVRLRARAGAR